jgi:hypothetical protein
MDTKLTVLMMGHDVVTTSSKRFVQPCFIALFTWLLCLIACWLHDCVIAASAADPLQLTEQLLVGKALGFPELDFNQLQNVMLVESGARLEIQDLLLSNIPSAAAYVYTDWQPWRNAGVCKAQSALEAYMKAVQAAVGNTAHPTPCRQRISSGQCTAM